MTRYHLDLTRSVRDIVTDSNDEQARAAFVRVPGSAARAFSWPQVAGSPPVFRARCGRRREYPTEADALAYERGYYHPEERHDIGTPAFVGWCDFEFDQQMLDDARKGLA